MTDDFQQTVNLRDRAKKGVKKPAFSERQPALPKAKKQVSQDYGKSKRARQIDQVYDKKIDEEIDRQDLQKISKPKIRQVNESIYKRIIFILAFVIIGLTVYSLFFMGGRRSEPAADITAELKWYAVKLITDEVYYGQINDIAADPVVISNVYYDYDQLQKDASADSVQEKSESANLRLVKRGKETHGPEGTMNIVRSQVVYMEPLKEDSKVLKAILDYER
jgi:hypothetical protein